jgi:hypothetical protein
MDESRPWPSARDGHLERVDDELCAEIVAHRPADDAAGEAVDDRGESQPPAVGMYLMSATQSSFGAAGTNSRPTRSAAGRTPGTRIVVRARFGGTAPESRRVRISRSIRLRPTWTPCWRRAAWIRRAP